MQYLEISLKNGTNGWYWTLLSKIGRKTYVINRSDNTFPTASLAAAEAEAQIFAIKSQTTTSTNR